MVRSDEIKKELLAANPQDGFGENRDKKVSHARVYIYRWIFNVVGLFCLLEVLVQIHGIMDSSKF